MEYLQTHLTWKPQVRSNEWGHYVSRQRKKKDAEYLHPDGKWLSWAHYYPTPEEANKCLSDLNDSGSKV
jgi:hypothetical protein